MVNLASVASLTAHERSTLQRMLATVASGGVASVCNGPNASPRNHAFVRLFDDLVDGGLLQERPGTAPGPAATGPLALAGGNRDAVRGLAQAAAESGDSLVAALGSAMTAEAVAARLTANARHTEQLAAAQAGRPHPSIPPPPGYDRGGTLLPGQSSLPAAPSGGRAPLTADPTPASLVPRASLSSPGHVAALPDLRDVILRGFGPATDVLGEVA